MLILKFLQRNPNPLHHSKFENHIEEQRAIWLDASKKYIINIVKERYLTQGFQLQYLAKYIFIDSIDQY